MKKISIYIPRMGSGGAERVVSILANNLSENYEVKILTLVSEESFYQLDDKVKLISANYCLNRSTKWRRLFSMARYFADSIQFVRKTVKEDHPDIVISFLPQMDIVVYLALLGIKIPVKICSERGDPFCRGIMMQFMLNQIYRRSNLLVCQSETVSQYYKMIDTTKKRVIANPVDFTGYPERVSEAEKKRIVGVGRLRKQKNFGLLIESFSQIAENYPDVDLVIYGEGPQRSEFEKRIEALGLENRIFLPGASQDVLLDIRDAAVFVMSSNYEGFPNALVEAIAMGIPVISTDFATGVAHEIISKDVGLVVPCENPFEMAEAMKNLLENNEIRRHIRNSGYKQILKFDARNVVKVWEREINRLLDK